jgi:uncharacterized protein YraI
VKKAQTFSLLVLFLLLSSCNIPGGELDQPGIMTAAALTVQASLATPLASPTTGGQGINPEGTATFSQPMITVGDVINCRSGPSKDYERITQITPGQSVKIIGFFPPNYWVVSSSQGECWLSGEFATPSGSYQAVPTVTAPPTPEGKVPTAPSIQKWDYVCDGTVGQAQVSIRWSDKADNETGYRVYRNGQVAVELPPNSTQFSETISLLPGQSAGYNIEVYNLIGKASSKVITITC